MGKVKIVKRIATAFFVLCLALVVSSNISLAKNPDVAPKVSITSPQDGTTVSEDTLNVVVSFGPKEKGKGNVRTIKLKLDGNLVATHDNPVQIKEGSYTFKLDIANLSDGDHTLQTFAYQAEERAMLEGASAIVTFIKGFKKEFKVKISSPIDGSIINRWETIVSGVIEPFPTKEVGITVNGNIALINGDRFAATVPLEKGTNTIEAKAVDWSGYVTTDSITINNDNPVVSKVSIDPYPAIGIIPLKVTFSVITNIPHPITLYEMDYDNDGVVDYSSEEITQLSHEYYAEHLYYPKLTVTDEEGNQYSGITLVNVIPMPDLVTKWETAKTALSQGNIDEALKYYALSEEEKQEARNNAQIIRAHLSEIMQDMGEIRFIEFKGNVAIYEMFPTGEGPPDSIIFVQDVDGLWKILGE